MMNSSLVPDFTLDVKYDCVAPVHTASDNYCFHGTVYVGLRRQENIAERFWSTNDRCPLKIKLADAQTGRGTRPCWR